MKCYRWAAVAALLVTGLAVVHAQGWLDLGVEESDARTELVQTVLNGSIPGLGAQAFKRATPAVRAALVQKAVTWAKAFTQSAAFKSAYDAARANGQPEPPQKTGTFREQLAKQRADLDAQAAEMRKSVAGQSKEIRDTVETAVTQMRAQLDAVAANPEQMKTMEAATAESQAAEQARYQDELRKFNAEHPAASASALALRLRRFLDVCGSVDFAATLVPVDGRMKFANPQYEDQSSEWKLCFRAGREPVEQAKTLARAWLKDMGQ